MNNKIQALIKITQTCEPVLIDFGNYKRMDRLKKKLEESNEVFPNKIIAYDLDDEEVERYILTKSEKIAYRLPIQRLGLLSHQCETYSKFVINYRTESGKARCKFFEKIKSVGAVDMCNLIKGVDMLICYMGHNKFSIIFTESRPKGFLNKSITVRIAGDYSIKNLDKEWNQYGEYFILQKGNKIKFNRSDLLCIIEDIVNHKILRNGIENEFNSIV